MANLYDTGGPRRVIVENQPSTAIERVVERVVVFPLCEQCGRQTRTVPCEWCGGTGKPRPRPAAKHVGPPQLGPAGRKKER